MERRRPLRHGGQRRRMGRGGKGACVRRRVLRAFHDERLRGHRRFARGHLLRLFDRNTLLQGGASRGKLSSMRRRSATFLLAVPALLACSAEAEAPEPASGTVLQPIAGGELDRDHSEVVELVTEFGSSAVGLCTGTL